MKAKKTARHAALCLALALCVTMLCACTGKKKVEQIKSVDGALFDKSTQIAILIGSHTSWPYNENWEFWRYFREAVGADIKLTVIPNEEFKTKLGLMMASPDTLPDLIHMSNKEWVNSFANSGAFVAIDDYLDKMPNYTEFWNRFPEEERERLMRYRVSSDGKTYFPQSYGSSHWTNLYSWLYRKDIFEKHGLKAPETLDELYNVASELKELYPDSFPICIRQGLSRLDLMGPAFKPYFRYGFYYDFANGKWSLGVTEPVMLDIVNYFIRLREAGLVPTDYLTINIKSWEELASTDRGFIMPEYFTRIDFFNIPNRVNNPDFTWDIMTPPRGANGTNKIVNANIDMQGYVVCNSGDKKRIDNAIKLLDWLYTDEASELFSWGREGETYVVENGEKKFVLAEGETAIVKYGAHSAGLYQRIEPEAIDSRYSEEQSTKLDFAHECLEDEANPKQWIALTDDEQREIEDKELQIKDFSEEMLSKFLLGQEPLSKWDSFINELKSMGIDEVISVYTQAYERVSG